MSTLEKAFYHHTKDDPGVAAAVNGRVYRMGEAPSSIKPSEPYITFQRITTGRVRHQDGVSGLADVLIQATCWASSATVAKDVVAEALRAAWQLQKGATGETGDTIDIKVATIDNETQGFENPEDASQVGWKSYILDIAIWQAES